LVFKINFVPAGIEIFLTYKYGSPRSAVEGGGRLALPQLQWLGVLPSELCVGGANPDLPIPGHHFLPLLPSDKVFIYYF
jgi:hypothetical protein